MVRGCDHAPDKARRKPSMGVVRKTARRSARVAPELLATRSNDVAVLCDSTNSRHQRRLAFE
jgi:hypothetical protein